MYNTAQMCHCPIPYRSVATMGAQERRAFLPVRADSRAIAAKDGR